MIRSLQSAKKEVADEMSPLLFDADNDGDDCNGDDSANDDSGNDDDNESSSASFISNESLSYSS